MDLGQYGDMVHVLAKVPPVDKVDLFLADINWRSSGNLHCRLMIGQEPTLPAADKVEI